MSILQIQRQQALRDLQVLEQQKGVALRDPEGFVAAVKDGRVRSRDVRGVGPYDGEGDEEEEEEEREEGGGERESRMEIPGSQNIVRAPPINWAQYHIVGESLDKLHEEQRRRPVTGAPINDEELRPKERGRERGRERAPEHTIARPYDPFVDKLASGGAGAGAGVGRRGKETGAGAGGGGGKKRG